LQTYFSHSSWVHGFKSLPLMNQQRLDPPHNNTPYSSISTTTQCNYSLLHFYHGTSVSKPSLALHLRLVPWSPFLVIFTLLRHRQVTSYLEPTLSIQLKSHNNHYPYPTHTLSIVHHAFMTWVILFWSHILMNINIDKPIHDSLYPLHFGLILLTLSSISTIIASLLINTLLFM
jgi:hypothetical protein